jgi:acetoacetyl-CoA synthetase
VPDEIVAAPAIPVTHAGKKIEIPVKRLFAGVDPAKVDRGALANPDALDWFIETAREFRSVRGLA